MALVNPTFEHGWLSFPVVGRAGHAAGVDDLGSVVNPEGVPIIVTSCIVYRATASAGAANITVGHAANITAAHDTEHLCAAQAINGAVAGTAITGIATGDPGDTFAVVPAGNVISAYASAASTGFTGRVYLHYVRAA